MCIYMHMYVYIYIYVHNANTHSTTNNICRSISVSFE